MCLVRDTSLQVWGSSLILLTKQMPSTHGLHFMQDQYKELGKNVAETKLEQMRAQMASFKEHLEDFALKHR